MKITFVLPEGGLNGGTRVVARYAEKMVARGHEVTIVSRPAPRRSTKEWAREFVKRGAWPKGDDKSSHLDQLKGVAHHVVQTHRPILAADVPDADVVVATWWETAEWVAKFPPSKGRQFHLVQGYEVFPYLPIDRVQAVYRLPLTRIAVSRWVAEQIRLEGDQDVLTIPNAVDHSMFSSPPRSKQSEFTVGFLYSSQAIKNSRLALDVVSEAARDFRGIRVRAFGEEALPPGDRDGPSAMLYRVKPPQRDIPAIYAECDVWLFTSTSEGFGLPILEAMASRTPVVATRAGAAPDIIDGKNGFLEDATVEAFLERLRLFARMSDPEWRAVSDAAYQTAISYTWEDATERFERVLIGR